MYFWKNLTITQQNQKMENKSNNSGLKAAVVVLALLFLGSVGYIFKLNSDNKETVEKVTTEKNTLAEELKAKIARIIADKLGVNMGFDL